MIYLATTIYLLYALYRRDISLYEFDEPILLWDDPKYQACSRIVYSSKESGSAFDVLSKLLEQAHNDKH